MQLIAAAQQGLKRIFRCGFSYQRAGILLPDLWSAHVSQLSLFDSGESNLRSDQLMTALDDINRKHGNCSIRYASEMLSKRWRMRQQFKSPSYTTNINELLTVQI